MKLFPIMARYGGHAKELTTDYIPWVVIQPHGQQALKNHGQTLERLAERGGLDYAEVLAVLENRPYSNMWLTQSENKRKVFNIIMDFEEVKK